MDDKLWLCKASFSFTQPGNSDGTTAEYEELAVEVASNGDLRQDPFYMVLRTSTGWSIETPEELLQLLNEVNEKVKTFQDSV